MGCYMNGLFTGVFIYADDITLLATSRYGLECMLHICLSDYMSHKNVSNAVKKFNRKSNELYSDFKILPCRIIACLFNTFCLDA